MTYDFISAYILHFSESQDPIPGNLSSMAQTGDFWLCVIAILFGVLALSIIGIFASKKIVKSNINVGEAIISKKGIFVIASTLLVVCCSVCILMSNKANAEENHIDPIFEDISSNVNGYVGNPSGKITVDNFKLINKAPVTEEYEVINIHEIYVIAGNGFEDVKAHLRVTDVTSNEVLFDGYMNTADNLCHSVRLDDEIKVEFIDISPEDAKNLIGKDGCVVYLGGDVINSESYSDITNVEINLNNDNVQVSDVAKNALLQAGWEQGSESSSRLWKKSVKAGLKTQDLLNVFKKLIDKKEIKFDGFDFAGWIESYTSYYLSPTIPYYFKDFSWEIHAHWVESPREKIDYVLQLQDTNSIVYKLTEKGQNVLDSHNEWDFDEANNRLICKDVSIDLKPKDVISIWTSDTLQVKDPSTKAHFNYWGTDLMPISNNILLWNLETGRLEINVCSWFEEEPVNVETNTPAAEATAGDDADNCYDHDVASDEPAVDEEVPADDNPLDYLIDDLPEAFTPIALLLLFIF